MRSAWISEDIDVFGFEVGPENLLAIDVMDAGVRNDPDTDFLDLTFLTVGRR